MRELSGFGRCRCGRDGTHMTADDASGVARCDECLSAARFERVAARMVDNERAYLDAVRVGVGWERAERVARRYSRAVVRAGLGADVLPRIGRRS